MSKPKGVNLVTEVKLNLMLLLTVFGIVFGRFLTVVVLSILRILEEIWFYHLPIFSHTTILTKYLYLLL
jgi:hypothetical protein